MEMQEIFDRLKAAFPEQVLAFEAAVAGESAISVAPAGILEVCAHLKSDPSLEFDYLMCLSGMDYYPEKLAVTYHLYSDTRRHRVVLRVYLPREENPQLPSVSRVWKTANWHEREAYDLFGIVFTGHPGLRRLLLPHDWEGYPLRKDYVFPTEYRGIKCHD